MNVSRKIAVVAVLVFSLGVCAFILFDRQSGFVISPVVFVKEKPLEQYEILRLAERQVTTSRIIFASPTATTAAYTVFPFSFTQQGKRVTGVAHIPNTTDPLQTFPVIVQLRGYVDRDAYTPGMGTTHSAEVYASNGFISLAPDFLGYGGSDMPSVNSLEERFETYITALTLLASIKTIPQADPARIGLWGHSNGGQIALTVLTILGEQAVPTVLWAPVTKPFPYNILYYTDEFSDRGKALRKVVAAFEEDYDADLYSLTQYIFRIAVPIQIHQGTVDASVPVAWSDTFVKTLEELGKDVTYYRYIGADHNLAGADAWNSAMRRDMQFFRSHWK